MDATRKVVLLAGIAALAIALWYGLDRPATGATGSAIIAKHDTILASSNTGTPPPLTTDITKPASEDADSGNSVDICGVGSVRLSKGDPTGEGYVEALAMAAEGKWLASLQASSEIHARAAALMLAGSAQSDALAQLALRNADPVLYDLALDLCARTEHASLACAQITPAGYAELDADNAVPWLQVAWRARSRGDSAGEAGAIQRAAAAHHFDDYIFSLYAYAQAYMPSDLSPTAKNYLAIEALGVETSSGETQNIEASKYCSKDAVNDVHVADRCRAIAELMQSQGSTLLDLGLAKSIGARAGWDTQRVADATRYFEALMAEVHHTEPGPGAARWSCGAVEASSGYFNDVAHSSEVQALRERVERSGISVPELAQDHRDYVEKIMKNAENELAVTQPDVRAGRE